MSRPLGFGLIVLGAVLGGIVLLWLGVSLVGGQLSAGGTVLGLLLVAALGLPLVGGGLFVLSRAGQESADAARFQRQRQVLESDRSFRAEHARELGQLSRRVGATGSAAAVRVASQLRDLGRDLDQPGYDRPGWYEAVELGPADWTALQRYESLLGGHLSALAGLVDRLESTGGAEAASLLPTIQSTARAYGRELAARAELLRGRRAEAVAPGELLGNAPVGASDDAVTRLKPGDAITWDGADYLIEARIDYFVGGRDRWLHRLASERDERWLAVSPGGRELALFRALKVPSEPGRPTIALDGEVCQLEGSEEAVATIETRDGQRSSGNVTSWRYRCPDGRLVVQERWEDGARAYTGQPIRASDLELWPAAVPDPTGEP